MIHVVGNKHFSVTLALWRRYQKCASGALRRTSRLPDGSEIPVAAVAQLSYLEMATGRSRHVTDWANEKHKRTQCCMYLKLPFDVVDPSPVTNSLYLSKLGGDLYHFLHPLV